MKKFWVNFICSFVPFKGIRHNIRAKLLKKNNSLDCAILQSKLDICLDRLNFLEKLIKTTVCVSDIPPASGVLELVQKSEVAILKRFSEVIKQHKLRWWIDSGTLIGYIRHNGFIPWDDDIDICVMREDYEKLPEILLAEFTSGGFFFTVGDIIRLYYKELHIWVDVFPIDQGGKRASLRGEEYENFVEILNYIKSLSDFNHDKWLHHEAPVSKEYIQTALKLRDEKLVPQKAKDGFLFLGVETSVRNRCLIDYDWVFPLKKSMWMGVEVYIPSHPDYYLTAFYGDYMGWPDNFCAAHGVFSPSIRIDLLQQHQELINNFSLSVEK